MGVVAEVSIDWSKIFFFHQSKPMINMLFECVVTGLSIDNSKIFFGRALSECKCRSGRLFKSVCLSVG